jgi:hypothetical protein
MTTETSAVVAEAERRENAARHRGRDEMLLAAVDAVEKALPREALAHRIVASVAIQNAFRDLEKL